MYSLVFALAVSGQAQACPVAVRRRNVIVQAVPVVQKVRIVAPVVKKIVVFEELYTAGAASNPYGAAIVPSTAPAAAPPAKDAPPAKEEPAKGAEKEGNGKLTDEQLLIALEKIGASLGTINKRLDKADARMEALEKAKPPDKK